MLLEDARDPESLSYGDAWARLIKLRFLQDDEGNYLVEPALFEEIRKEAESWAVHHPTSSSPHVHERVRAALHIANMRLKEPEMITPEFG